MTKVSNCIVKSGAISVHVFRNRSLHHRTGVKLNFKDILICEKALLGQYLMRYSPYSNILKLHITASVILVRDIKDSIPSKNGICS